MTFIDTINMVKVKGKDFSVLTQALLHEDVLGSLGIAPRILWPRH
jgi:hypothetical protein